MPKQIRLEDNIASVWIERLADKVYKGLATEQEEEDFFKYINDEV